MLASAARHRIALITVSLCAVLVLAACRAGVPVIGATPGPPAVSGTITGTISTEDGKSGIQGRKVTAVNLDTGVRRTVISSETGGYTLQVPPGKYRMEVELAAGEAIVKNEGTFSVSKSELQHDVDLRIGARRSSDRIYQPLLPSRAPRA